MADSAEAIIEMVRRRFPFVGYMDSQSGSYRTVAGALVRHLPQGSVLLDFGSGPCDKAAVAAELGYTCCATDDLDDSWHREPGVREKIEQFAHAENIDFRRMENRRIPDFGRSFDLIMLNDVLEHLHDSPRDLLNDLLCLVKERGYLLVTVPNAVNIRKRLDVLRGRTNLPSFAGYYWYPGQWRGHVREYTRGDLELLCEYLNLEIVELHGCDHMLHKLTPFLRPAFKVITTVFGDWRDSWILCARKRDGWQPRRSLPPEEMKRVFGPDCPAHIGD